MKRLLSILFLLGVFVATVDAHPITVTLSNGKKVVLESTDYPTINDLLDKIIELENGSN